MSWTHISVVPSQYDSIRDTVQDRLFLRRRALIAKRHGRLQGIQALAHDVEGLGAFERPAPSCRVPIHSSIDA